MCASPACLTCVCITHAKPRTDHTPHAHTTHHTHTRAHTYTRMQPYDVTHDCNFRWFSAVTHCALHTSGALLSAVTAQNAARDQGDGYWASISRAVGTRSASACSRKYFLVRPFNTYQQLHDPPSSQNIMRMHIIVARTCPDIAIVQSCMAVDATPWV